MELRGVEPRSEGTSIEASPITVAVYSFPPGYARRQAYPLSSFINLLPLQSLNGKGPHIVDASYRDCERSRADKQH